MMYKPIPKILYDSLSHQFRMGLVILCMFVSQASLAEQRLDMEGAAIFGNKESPNILYVVPWRKPNPLAPMEPPRMSRLDELLAPLDRDVFRRQVDWHQTFGDKL